MFVAREFVNLFSEELNNCFEDSDNGVASTIYRYKQLIQTIEQSFMKECATIPMHLEKEEESVRLALLSQPDVINQIYFFNDLIYKSLVVSICSYFEYKLQQISTISEAHNSTLRKIKNYEKKNRSTIQACNSFLIHEIVPELDGLTGIFTSLQSWNEVRNSIVHRNSANKTSLSDFFVSHNSFRIEEDCFYIKDAKNILEYLSLINNYLSSIIELINTEYKLVVYRQSPLN